MSGSDSSSSFLGSAHRMRSAEHRDCTYRLLEEGSPFAGEVEYWVPKDAHWPHVRAGASQPSRERVVGDALGPRGAIPD